MRKFIVWSMLCCALGYSSHGFSQNERMIDSLLRVIQGKGTKDTTLIKAYNDIGVLYATTDAAKAMGYINKAIHLSKETGNKRGLAGAENCKGVVYYYSMDYENALIHFQKALAINQELGHLWGEASALFQIAAVHKNQSKIRLAISDFQHTAKLFDTLNDSLSLAKSYESIGSCYSRMNFYDDALEYYLKSIRIYERMDNSTGIVRGYTFIGIMWKNAKQYQKGLDYFVRAMAATEVRGSERTTANLYLLIAQCHVALGEFEKAMDFTTKAIADTEDLKSIHRIGYLSHVLMGEIQRGLGDYPNSITHLEKALNMITAIDSTNTIHMVTMLNSMAKTYQLAHKYDRASHYAQSAIEAAVQIENLSAQIEGWTTMADVAVSLGENHLANQYFKTLLDLKDSLGHRENRKRMDELVAFYETEKNENQLALQTLKINNLEQHAANYRTQINFYIAGTALLAVMLSLLIYIIRQRTKNTQLKAEHAGIVQQKLDQELASKQRELTTATLNLTKKNRVMQELKEIVMASNKGAYEKEAKALLHIIDAELKDDDQWEAFIKSFEQIHPDFYANLRKKYPTLTSTDLRIISFLKMNLSNTEICSILSITPDGVKKARYRLRKKMGIKSEESLNDVVLGL